MTIELSLRMARLERRLERLTQIENYLTVREAAEYLGYKYDYMRKLVSRGVVPHYSPTNGKVLMKRTELDEWVSQHKVNSNKDR